MSTRRLVDDRRVLAWQHRWPVSQQVLIAVAAAASKPRPLAISKREDVDLLPDEADAATGKHRHCDVTGYVDRHCHESPSATQPRHRLHTAPLDQGNALCQDVVSQYFHYLTRLPLWSTGNADAWLGACLRSVAELDRRASSGSRLVLASVAPGGYGSAAVVMGPLVLVRGDTLRPRRCVRFAWSSGGAGG